MDKEQLKLRCLVQVGPGSDLTMSLNVEVIIRTWKKHDT